MQKASEIISKEIISIYECESIGTIKNVMLSKNYKKIIAFVFFDDQSDFDSGVLSKDIYSFSEDGVLIKNISKTQYHFNQEPSPMNKKVFSLSGEDFGKINDIIFDEKFNIISFQTNKNKSFVPSQIFKMGFDICIIKKENENVKSSSFMPPKNTITPDPILDSLTVKIVKISDNEQSRNSETNALPQFPVKVQLNTDNLIGKTALKTITGLNNEIIVKQNAVISQHTINLARVHNRLNHLILNTSQ